MSGNNTRQYGELIKIGTPVIIGQLGTIVLGFADTLMIGHHSTNELAAAGLVNNVFALVLLFYLGFPTVSHPLWDSFTALTERRK